MSMKTTLSTGLVAVLSLSPGTYWGCETQDDGPVGGSQPDDRPPALIFETPADGAVITQPVRYGSVQVQAWDPDTGTANGDGIRSVSMVVTDAASGRVVAARSEYWPTYDFGPALADGVYTLEATAYPDWLSGRATTTASITITVDVDGTVVVPTSVPPTPAPTSTAVPPTPVPTSTAVPATPVPTSTAVPPTPVPATPVPTSTPVPPTPVPATPVPTSTPVPPTPVPATPVPTSTPVPPTPVPATPVPTPAASAGDAVSASLNALNQVRANAGLPPLTLNASMSSFALNWSQTMSQSGFRHSSGPYGENIAWYSDGSLSPQAAATFFNDGWVNSPGHYRNMVNAGYTEIGIGLYQDAGGWWATHVFR